MFTTIRHRRLYRALMRGVTATPPCTHFIKAQHASDARRERLCERFFRASERASSSSRRINLCSQFTALPVCQPAGIGAVTPILARPRYSRKSETVLYTVLYTMKTVTRRELDVPKNVCCILCILLYICGVSSDLISIQHICTPTLAHTKDKPRTRARNRLLQP